MYWVLMMISIVCLSGNSDNFFLWLIWELAWFVVLMWSSFMIEMHKEEKNAGD